MIQMEGNGATRHIANHWTLHSASACAMQQFISWILWRFAPARLNFRLVLERFTRMTQLVESEIWSDVSFPTLWLHVKRGELGHLASLNSIMKASTAYPLSG